MVRAARCACAPRASCRAAQVHDVDERVADMRSLLEGVGFEVQVRRRPPPPTSTNDLSPPTPPPSHTTVVVSIGRWCWS